MFSWEIVNAVNLDSVNLCCDVFSYRAFQWEQNKSKIGGVSITFSRAEPDLTNLLGKETLFESELSRTKLSTRLWSSACFPWKDNFDRPNCIEQSKYCLRQDIHQKKLMVSPWWSGSVVIGYSFMSLTHRSPVDVYCKRLYKMIQNLTVEHSRFTVKSVGFLDNFLMDKKINFIHPFRSSSTSMSL